MVVYTPYQLEWEEPHIPETPTDFGNRFLPTGMGSDVRGSHNRRALVERGAEPPHKLPRTLGSLPGSEMLRQRQEKHHHTTEDGQHHCNRNRLGGTVSPRLNQLTKDLWLWCMERDMVDRTDWKL